MAGLLNWLGGIGIIVVAMVFLPELRVGGMQIFRAESFDTMGKDFTACHANFRANFDHLYWSDDCLFPKLYHCRYVGI